MSDGEKEPASGLRDRHELWQRDAMAALEKLRRTIASADADEPWIRWASGYLAAKRYRPDGQLIRSLCWFAERARTQAEDKAARAFFADWASGLNLAECARNHGLTVSRAQAVLENVRRHRIAREWERAGGRVEFLGDRPARWSNVGRR